MIVVTSDLSTIATFADDTAILVSHVNPKIASDILQNQLSLIQEWFKLWKIKVNESKIVHVTSTLNNENCPPIYLNNQVLPHQTSVRYLGMH